MAVLAAGLEQIGNQIGHKDNVRHERTPWGRSAAFDMIDDAVHGRWDAEDDEISPFTLPGGVDWIAERVGLTDEEVDDAMIEAFRRYRAAHAAN
jgi:hypothetical protein